MRNNKPPVLIILFVILLLLNVCALSFAKELGLTSQQLGSFFVGLEFLIFVIYGAVLVFRRRK